VGDCRNLRSPTLAANNALDFDDLILVPVRLFQQNEQVLGYWYQKFHHILVDEYQDTNRTQYDLIRLLVTNAETRRAVGLAQSLSFFVGDADQSIYSGWQTSPFCWTFNKTLAMDCRTKTRTMVKLEENYRSGKHSPS